MGGSGHHLLILLSTHGTTLPTDSRYVDYRGSGGGGQGGGGGGVRAPSPHTP